MVVREYNANKLKYCLEIDSSHCSQLRTVSLVNIKYFYKTIQ